jgi:hypothetical protein
MDLFKSAHSTPEPRVSDTLGSGVEMEKWQVCQTPKKEKGHLLDAPLEVIRFFG